MTGRNELCPCGSGKKYKHCHLDADERIPRPLRLLRGDASPAGPGRAPRDGAAGAPRPRGSVALPPDAVVPTDYWEVDLLPLGSSLENDPSARPTMLLVGAGDYVLHVEVVSHPPTVIGALGDLLASALEAANRSTGKRPQVVLTRHPVVAELLELLLQETRHPMKGTRVGVSPVLVRVDDAIESFEASSGAPRRSATGRVQASSAVTWGAWGIPAPAVGAFFAAAAAYHRAAPWTLLDGDQTVTVTVRDGGVWEAGVMGRAGEVFGLALYADPMDLLRMHAPAFDETADETPSRLRGMMLSMGFEDRADLPKPMREEVRREGWEVAGPRAYPALMVLNSPGGMLAPEHLLDLTAALRAITGFVAKHAAVLRGEAKGRYPLKFTDRAIGASVAMEARW